jgi:hypothetical protein
MPVNTLFKIAALRPSKAPNLPVAPVEYSQQYQMEFNNALRLYFAQLDNFSQPFSSNTGGAFLKFPNGSFYQDGDTALTTSITNTSTTPIVVASTAGFLTSGAILIGTEIIAYTGITSTSFTGITRGAYHSSNSAHTAGVAVTEAQPVPNATTALAVTMTITTASNQVTINPADKTQIIHDIAGYYNLQFSAQLLSYDNVIDDCSFWFRVNGVDIPESLGLVTIPGIHAGIAGTNVVAWNVVTPLNAGDYVQLMYSSLTGNTVLSTLSAQTGPVRPVSPSVTLTSTFVSALY